MKYMLTLISILYIINCFSQTPNPDLFQTWYLRSVQSSDISPLVNVWQITPAISPTLTISNTLDYNGVGACNTFNGIMSNATSNYFQTTPFSETGAVCGIMSHDSFEDNYFGFLQSAFIQYYIYPEESGLGLMLNTALFGQARFQNYQLNSSDFAKENIAIYPNPAKVVLNINANQLAISKMQIINSLGQIVRTINDNFEVIAIADLATGMYILKMDTSLGTINKKIVKD